MFNISFLLVLTNQSITRTFSNILLNRGIISYIANNPDEAIEIINKHNINCIFLDLDFGGEASFLFLDKLKKEKKNSSIIIATSYNSYEQFIKRIQQYNIFAFLLKPVKEEDFKEKVDHLLIKFKDHFPERKHIRVVPDQEDIMIANFKLKSGKRISAKVIDISLGGIALEMFTNYDDNEIQPGKLIEHLIFEANNKEIDTDAKIITRKNNILAFKFTHFYNDSYENLLKFILKCLKS